MKKKIPVLITGLSGGSHGMQILKALKLAKTPYEFIGTNNTDKSYGKSFVDKHYLVPSAKEPEYIDTLLKIAEKNLVKAIFHGSEPELIEICQNRKKFEQLGVLVPINRMDIIKNCMNKIKTMTFLKSKGFNVPNFFLVEKESDIKRIETFPLVCKPHIGSGGSANIFIVQNASELVLISKYMLQNMDSFLIQEYIGIPEEEYTIGVLNDLSGKLIDSIGIKRYLDSGLSSKIKVLNKTGNPKFGNVLMISSGISQGEVGRFSEITNECEKIAIAFNSMGPLNIQGRVQDNKFWVFEINPRFSGTTSLRALSGFNEPDLIIRRHLLGERKSKIQYREEIILRGLEEKIYKKND